jgi:hypothetical protein
MEARERTAAGMKQVEYERNGRKYLVQLPDEAPDSEAELGIPIGPPDIDALLPLPEPFATRLHNELYRRGIFSLTDTIKRQNEVRAALLAACNLDVQTIQAKFYEFERLRAQEVNNG